MNHNLSDQESLVKRASYLRLLASGLSEGMKSGNFKSLYRGQGIEFSGVRDYIPGDDDIRSIDWNVTARMCRPYVKIFEEERELQVFILVDSSASMQIKTEDKRTKYSAAAESAALLILAAEMSNCPIGGVFFDGAIHFSCKPTFGKEQTMLMLSHLDKLPVHQVKGSVLGPALTGAGKFLKKRSLVFVLSDFRSGEYEKPLIQLAQKNDIVAIRIQDKMDDELPSLGTVTFVDVESGLKMQLPSSSAKLKKQWSDYMDRNENQWKNLCLKHGITTAILRNNDDPLRILSSILIRKK